MPDIPIDFLEKPSQEITVKTVDGNDDLSALVAGDLVSVRVGGRRPLLLPAEHHVTTDGSAVNEGVDGVHTMLDGAQIGKLGQSIVMLSPGVKK